jgi:hypothetical protein
MMGAAIIFCEVVGDPSDPMTSERTAIFNPLGLELSRQMEAAFGTTPEEAGPVAPPPRLPETKEVIESKIIPCKHLTRLAPSVGRKELLVPEKRCGTMVAIGV